MLLLAGLVSASAIGVALLSNGPAPTVADNSGALAVAPAGAKPVNDLSSWEKTLEDITPVSGEESGVYVAPRALPTTDALAREVFAVYAKARSDGTFEAGEIESGLAQVIAQNAPDLATARKYTLSDVRAEADVTLVGYESSVMSALRQATAVREYELNVFARAISSNSAVELKKLEATALVYEGIRDTLLTIEVPERLVDQHLQVINDLSAVAAAVRGLSGWTGDPIDALVLVNEFRKREQRFAEAMTDFNTIVSSLKKQT